MDTQGEHYEPFDPGYARGVIGGLFEPMLRHWFRPRLLGAHRLPANGPLILAPNHSGNAFPYDGMVLDGLLWHNDGMTPESKFRSLFEKELAQTWWMRPFGLDNFWRRCAGVDITFDNFERLLLRGDRTIYYPEGVKGIGKGFHRRYELQPFHTSFVVLAARHRVPVVPIYVVNAEWIVPFTFTLPPLDWAMQKLFRVPFLPLPAAPLGMVFPWAWWLAFPARMVFVVGDPIDTADLCRRRGIDPDGEGLRPGAPEVAEDIRRIMQRELDRHVRRYGRWPYQARSLARAVHSARRRGMLGRTLPIGWTSAFVRFGRDLHRPPARNALHAVARDWDIFAYYVPFGWPLLTLFRRMRRPPYGYRGLSRQERIRREGNFIWRLNENPLPPRPSRKRTEEL